MLFLVILLVPLFEFEMSVKKKKKQGATKLLVNFKVQDSIFF
jgi:hypothetical protein